MIVCVRLGEFATAAATTRVGWCRSTALLAAYGTATPTARASQRRDAFARSCGCTAVKEKEDSRLSSLSRDALGAVATSVDKVNLVAAQRHGYMHVGSVVANGLVGKRLKGFLALSDRATHIHRRQRRTLTQAAHPQTDTLSHQHSQHYARRSTSPTRQSFPGW